jgi:hypothetical protein
VLGDPIYGSTTRDRSPRLMLHAWRLELNHPVTGEEMRFTAPPDALFRAPGEEELLRLIADSGL